MTERRCIVAGPAGPVEIGPGRDLAVIGGPCVLEHRDLAMAVAEQAAAAARASGLAYVFKGSFDKANRSSVASPRGPGLEEGLDLLAEIRRDVGVPVTTDVHEPGQAAAVAEVVDLLQIPAFLCRQTDLLVAVSEAARERGRAVNVKKGQFLAPSEMRGPLGKCAAAGCANLLVTERGTFFGYHRLVTDLIGLGDLLELPAPDGGGSVPVCFDATHSSQLPGATETSGGRPERVPLLARAAVAAGVHAVFVECHPEPAAAASDAATMLPLAALGGLLSDLARLRAALPPAAARENPEGMLHPS